MIHVFYINLSVYFLIVEVAETELMSKAFSGAINSSFPNSEDMVGSYPDEFPKLAKFDSQSKCAVAFKVVPLLFNL